jgi:uncharacterized protein YqgC (DUF456 family)
MRLVLLAGDTLTLGLVTIYGFASHGELGSSSSRILATFAPLVAAWFLVGPFLGVYNLERVADPRQLWRPFYAMVLAGPMVGFLRGWMLGNVAIMPIFVVVIGGISALALLAWRAIFWLVFARKR